MIKKLLLSLLFSSLFLSGSFSQNPSSPLEYRFKNGSAEFYKFMFQNVIFPHNSMLNNTIGLSISELRITPKGKIGEIKIINPINDEIDGMVKDLLEGTASGWLKCDSLNSDQIFYVQIAFNINGSPADFYTKNNFPDNKMFLDPVVVTAPRRNTRPPESKETLTQKYIDATKSGKYKNALSAVNELIKRYPYSKELYQMRMSVARNLHDNKLIENDLQKISNFANGQSLDKLFE
jgi:hypothetical protein